MTVRIRWVAATPQVVIAEVWWGHPSSFFELTWVPGPTEDVDVHALLRLLNALESTLRGTLAK